MKKWSLLLIGLALTHLTFAANPPSFGTLTSVELIQGSGNNQVIIPAVNDNDGLTQPISFTVTSNKPSVVEVLSVSYTTGNQFAIVNVNVNNVMDNVTLQVKLTDADGDYTRDVTVATKPYENPGVKFEIHDAVFWQEVIPLSGAAVYDTIIQKVEGPYSAPTFNWNNVPITVNSGCVGGICTGHDFFTAFYKGYILPKTSGDYTFFFKSANNGGFWLSDDTNYANAKPLAVRSNATNVGTTSGNETQSAVKTLEAGRAYAFYAVQWVIHDPNGGVLWQGPGISKAFIEGQYIMPLFDGIRPEAPSQLALQIKATQSFIINWNKASDNAKLAGYNIYVNGAKTNSEPVVDTRFEITGLTANTPYNVFVTAIDLMGNESVISNVLKEVTHTADAVKPMPPTQITRPKATGEALLIRWSGASDAQTEVIAYDVYVDGAKYNTNYIYTDSIIIYGRTPETSYNIEVVAYDAAYNASDKSTPFMAQTTTFDPLGDDLGEKRGRIVIMGETLARNDGIGINGPFTNGSMLKDAQIREKLDALKPGAIRWGAIDANSIGLSASAGTGKPNTYAAMLDYCIKNDAWFALTVGVMDGLDYRTNPETFANLMEYLGGPATSTWGAKRAAEGFTEPLLPKCKGIILEFGNEVWGAAAHDAQIGSNYTVYRQWCRDMAAVVKASPYYDASKIIFTYSGRNPSPVDSYGVNTNALTGDKGELDCLAVSGYLGGNMNYDPDQAMGESELQYYKLRYEQLATNLEGFERTIKEEMLPLTGTIKKFYLYESNATTPSYNGRLGQAILMTDYFASSMAYGSIVPSIFHLTGGEWRITQPEKNYEPLPLYITSMFFNRHTKGNVLKTRFETTNVITNVNGSTLKLAPVGAHAYANGTNYSVLLLSRDFENDYSVQIDLPDGFTAGSARKYLISGSDFSTRATTIDSSDISISDGMLVTVPKYSMVLIRFTGPDLNLTPKKFGEFAYIKNEQIEVKTVNDVAASITTQKGNVRIIASYLPADSYIKQCKWELVENSAKARYTVYGNDVKIVATGNADGNGTITLKAVSFDDPQISDQITITISGQGGVGLDNITQPTVNFYPNPADTRLFIECPGEQITEVSVVSLSGGLLLKQTGENDRTELMIESLKPGLYLAVVKTAKGSRTIRFSKK